MKVLYVASGRKYDVWAMCSEDDTCQVMETLQEISRDHRDLVEPLLVLLMEVVPNEGPPLHDEYRAKVVYRDLIYELKADKTTPTRKHLGLRVMFFFSPYEQVVVCTNAFCKSGNTPPELLDIALRERARFHEEHDHLEFVTRETRQ